VDAAQLKSISKGFLASLFDIHFNSFITRKLLTVIYVLAMIGIGLFFLIALVSALDSGGSRGLLVLIIGPILALLALVYVRVWLEFVAVIFSLYETTRRIEVELGKASDPRSTDG
jgi:Domain of unknown function (DUF4282)